MAELEEPNLAAGGQRDSVQAPAEGQVLRRAPFNTARANQVATSGMREHFNPRSVRLYSLYGISPGYGAKLASPFVRGVFKF